jgi:RNA polymerase sigma-70 factor (family 1)
MITGNLTDTDLLLRIQSGDADGFRELFNRYWQLLWQLATRKTGDAAEAEDIVQELFVDIWNKKGPVELTTTFQTYLISCLYLKLFKYFRQKGFRQKHQDHFAAFMQQVEIAGVPAELTAAEFETEYGKLQEVIAQVIALMPAQMQAVFTLRYYHGYSTAQIAEQLQVSTETVKTHLKLAMARLRKTGEEYPGAILLLPYLLEALNSSY